MTVTFCAFIKNEFVYLKNWIDYNLNELHVDSIYLIEDFDSKSHADIVKDYPNVYLANMNNLYPDYPDKLYVKRQRDSYNWFIKNNPTNCDWAAFFDIDEYLHFEEGLNLHDYLSQTKFKNIEALLVFWKVYGANGYVDLPDTNVEKWLCADSNLFEFRNRKDNLFWPYKSIVNMHNKVLMESAHLPSEVYDNKLNYHTSEDKREILRSVQYSDLWINHYITGSFNDFANKLRRGHVANKKKAELMVAGHTNLAACRDMNYFFEINPNMQPRKEELMKTVNTDEFLMHRLLKSLGINRD